jgi:hypothetical protein
MQRRPHGRAYLNRAATQGETSMTTDNTTEPVAFDFASLPITIHYAGQTDREDKWKCDEWRVRITNPSQSRHWTTSYYTGLGLRLPINPLRKGTLAYEALEKSRKPKMPQIADVLHALFMDADAADYNFNDWCDNYGYSHDSIKAMNTYKECLDIAANLRSFFTKEQRDAIYMAVQYL